MSMRSRLHNFALLGLAAVMLTTCGGDDSTATTAFVGPAGMVLAGSNHDRVFVANSGADALQVVSLADKLNAIDLVSAPARYFPLNIPAGPNPELVAASADGHFVFVLDTITSTVRLVDADALRLVRGTDDVPVTLPLGARESQPAALVGWASSCTPSETDPQSICLARVYALLRRPGLVVAVDVRQDNAGALSLRIDRSLPVGGSPMDMALHPFLAAAFITDTTAPYLTRLALADLPGVLAGTESHAGLGAPGGPVAVAADGSLIAVGRPQQQDIVFLSSSQQTDVSTGTLTILPAESVWTPLPACLASCGQAEADACSGAHQADEGLCLTPNGYADASSPYVGLYIGSVPRALLALGAAQHGGPLIERCISPSGGVGGQASYARAFAIAGLDGAVLFAGIPDGAGGTAGAPRLIETASCVAPFLQAIPGIHLATQEIFSACGDLPANHLRMSCLSETEGGTKTVALMRGHGSGLRMGLVWEGVVPGGDRSMGGGSIDAKGRVVDSSGGLALSKLDVVVAQDDGPGRTAYAGDILEVVSPAASSAACREALGNEVDLCALERRIVGFGDDDPDALVLDKPLPAACFLQPGSLAYRVRAGDSFYAGTIDDAGAFTETAIRLRPGDSYGPGRRAGSQAPIFFTLSPTLDIGSDKTACQLYRPDGEAAENMPTWRSRRGMVGFAISEPFALAKAGQSYDLAGAARGYVGRMPYGMVMTRPAQASQDARLLVSYGGSDALLITTPLDTAHLQPNSGFERLLR